MRYKVLPFRANITSAGGGSDVAKQLSELISKEATAGWEYVRLESVETYVAGNAGCLGFGATPPLVTSHSVAVFEGREPVIS